MANQPSPSTPVRVLFVCLGNICRSPTAEGVFRDLVRRQGLQDLIQTDSAGTGSWHIGSPPDPRAQLSAEKRGYDISDLRARQTRPQDFADFDYILAMDRQNARDLQKLGTGQTALGRLQLFLDFAPGDKGREVADPYYGGQEDYERAFELIDQAARGLLKHIQTSDLHRTNS